MINIGVNLPGLEAQEDSCQFERSAEADILPKSSRHISQLMSNVGRVRHARLAHMTLRTTARAGFLYIVRPCCQRILQLGGYEMNRLPRI